MIALVSSLIIVGKTRTLSNYCSEISLNFVLYFMCSISSLLLHCLLKYIYNLQSDDIVKKFKEYSQRSLQPTYYIMLSCVALDIIDLVQES